MGTAAIERVEGRGVMEGAERAARLAAHAVLSGQPLLAGLRAGAVLRAAAARGGDRRHGPWLELALAGAAVRVGLVDRRVLAFARAGLVPPGGEEASTATRPRLPQAVLVLAARAALDRWGGAWKPVGLAPRGARRARVFLRGGCREEAELVLDAHTGAVLAVSVWRVPQAVGADGLPIDRAGARRLAGLARDRLRGRGLLVPEAPLLLRDPHSGRSGPVWRCETWLARWPSVTCGPGERSWLLVDAHTGEVSVEPGERG